MCSENNRSRGGSGSSYGYETDFGSMGGGSMGGNSVGGQSADSVAVAHVAGMVKSIHGVVHQIVAHCNPGVSSRADAHALAACGVRASGVRLGLGLWCFP